MCKDAIFYSGTQLWSYIDNSVTSNTLTFDFYTYQANNQTRLSTPKVKFVIYSKNGNSTSATLSSSELYKYTYNLNNIIVKKLSEHKNKIIEDKKYTDGFCMNLYKNNIYTTIMYNVQLDSPCIRFMIGEKETLILDADKVYIPLIDFVSMYMTLNNTFNAFPMMSYNITYMDFVKKSTTDLIDKINSLEDKISNISMNHNNVIEKTNIEMIQDVNLDNIDIPDEKVQETKSEQQDDFTKFLDEKRDSFELDLPKNDVKKNEPIVAEKPKVEIEHKDLFSNVVLKNDFKNLQVIITNSVNTDLPVDSFVKAVKNFSGIDLYDGIKNIDKYLLNYVVNKNIKFHVNRYIQKKIDFPKNINPIVLDENGDNEDKIEVMYQLILYYIYLSKVKSQLGEKITSAQENKEFLSFSLKTITSAFVFTYLIKVNKNILVGYLNNLYYRIRNNGFFDNFEKEIFEKTRIKIDVDSKYITDQIERIYDKVILVKDKLNIKNFLSKIMKLKYKDFEILNKDEFNPDVLQKICVIENHFMMNKMDQIYDTLKSTNDIPQDILKIYGIGDKKFDNTVLVKYIQNVDKNFKDLEQIRNINTSVRDILNNINIHEYSNKILKALYFWDITKLPSNITYEQFSKIVDNSNLDDSCLISLIMDDKYKIDLDFYNSLNI